MLRLPVELNRGLLVSDFLILYWCGIMNDFFFFSGDQDLLR